MRLLRFTLCCTLVLLASCRAVVVDADAAGTQKLPLPGASGVVGVVTRDLVHGEARVTKGTSVQVEETLLLRHDRTATPRGYRISGLYDPSTQTDGLALPRHAVEVFYLAAVLPESRVRVVVPAEHFERR